MAANVSMSVEKYELAFQFSGKMARLLGRESVSSDAAALFELVKNGYDADASCVNIRFENFSSSNSKDGKIIIEDDGDGMTFDEIKDKWIVVGTYSKDDHTKTRKNRRVVGNKGIGRFATEKLAGKATIITRPRHSHEEVRFYLNWNSYEAKKITFNDITHSVERILERKDRERTGTTIILEDLRENWTDKKITALQASVASIVLPPELSSITNDKFDVIIHAPSFDVGDNTLVQSTLLKHAPFKLTANLLSGRDDFKIKIQKEGKVVSNESANLHDHQLPTGETWMHFGECKLVVYFYPGETRYEKWNKYYHSALKISRIHDALKEIHGVKIYRDEFWVRPYGEKYNDWLNLEKDRVQSNLKVGNSQVIGFVKITQDGNPELIDTTTRERLVENKSFESLKLFVKHSIAALNDFRKEENKRLREGRTKIDHKNFIQKEVKYLQESIDASDLTTREKKAMGASIKEIKRVFSDFKSKTDEEFERISSKERAVRNLASLGISSAATSHEIANVLSVLGEIPKAIRNKIKKTPIPVSEILEDTDDADKEIKSIKQFMLFINHFVKNLREDFGARTEKTSIQVGPNIEKLLKRFSPILTTKEIKVTMTSYPDDISVHMNKSDFGSIIINLLTNSIKALDSTTIQNRKIKITIQKDSNNLKLLFSDNGSGVSEANREKIFRLFFSTYKDGTGLGLAIVKEIVEEYGGKIEIKTESEFANGATFEAVMPVVRIKK